MTVVGGYGLVVTDINCFDRYTVHNYNIIVYGITKAALTAHNQDVD